MASTTAPDPLRFLRRAAGASWLFGSLAAGLLWGQFLASVLRPWAWTFVVLALGLIVATFACATSGTWRLARGPSRWRASGLAVVGLVPAAMAGAVILAGAAQYRRGHIAATVPFIAFARASTSLAEIEAPLHYRGRMTSEHLVMFYNSELPDPSGDLAAMERYVANLERITGRRLRTKIAWVRGPILGQRSLAIGRFALGSVSSPTSGLDRHELAHAVLYQAHTPATSPLMLLSEGWAESRCQDPGNLAERALRDREIVAALALKTEGERRAILDGWSDAEGYERLAARAGQVGPARMLYLRELTGPGWYHRDKGSVYNVGGAFVDFLVRTHGAERFMNFYLAIRPDRVDRAFREAYGRGIDEVEAEFWRECERLTRRSGTVR